MSPNQHIAITGMAAISPVGLTMEQTCAAIRAGICSFHDHPFYFPSLPNPPLEEPEPAVTASVPSIDPELDNMDRLLELFIPVLKSILEESGLRRTQLERGALFLALPHSDKYVEKWSLDARFLRELYKRTGLKPFKLDKINQQGNSGMFVHIAEATSLLQSGALDFCIVGGVDSYFISDRLAYLDESWRIKSARNPDGYIPGEAASTILLETRNFAETRNAKVLATISPTGSGQEPLTIESDKNSSGKGLCDAIKNALNNRERKTNIQWALCDLNGESYRSYEWGLALTRLPNLLSAISEVTHPADCMGDVGAATGGILIATAVQAFQRGYNISDEALLWTASDDGLRAAICVNQYTI